MASGKESSESGYMVPELRVERERSSLVLEELTNLLDSGVAVTEIRRRMYKTVADMPVFNQDDYCFNSAEEEFCRSMERSVNYVRYFKENNSDNYMEKHFFKAANPQPFPIDLSEGMFIPTIDGQGTDEQKAKWLPLAKSYSIIGAYAQTELGHGTYIRGLETTATYEPSTQQFVLHSPTLTSIKWWPGTLGHTATHAVVAARLITKGKDHGVHMFLVQLRSLEDHKPLPGVKVGDIGPKFGYKGMDNGFLQLTNVWIPRDQMLMKYTKVLPDGTYVKSVSEKISYGTMVLVRAFLVMECPMILSRTVTIAVRYSVVRRQTQNRPGEPETQVMDYQTQQYKLLPLIATTYAILLTGQYMLRLYTEMKMEISQGNFDSLPELHATSSGLKAFSSEVCSQGMEICRLACGGHGYSLASGIPTLYVNYTAAQTYEGENTVLYLQTARYLHKMFNQQLTQSQLPPNIAYLASDFPKHTSCAAHSPEQFSDPHLLLEAYRQRARRMVEVAAVQYQHAKHSARLDDVAAWNGSSVDWTNAAKAHCHFVVLRAFIEAIQNADVCPANLAILNGLCSLYAVFGIVQCSGEFTLNGYMSTQQMRMARTHLYTLLGVIRREAVPLVDAFDIPDAVLNSALGRYDGDVYRHLYEWAQKAPRNKSEVHDVYYKYLRPLIKSKL